MILVYFTTESGNVGRFVDKITKFNTARIPLSVEEAKSFEVTEEFVLIAPTYLAGNGKGSRTGVTKQIVAFLNNEQNRQLLRGVVGSGNTNYGPTYCLSAKIISEKCSVPLLHEFEISGTPEDVIDVEQKVSNLAEPSN